MDMLDILKAYLPLCWLRTNPLQLPHSFKFFQLNLALYFTVEFLTQANMIPPIEAFFEVLAENLLTLLFVLIILSLNRSLHCYLQVMSAILVSENIVAILGIPIIMWLTLTHSPLSYLSLIILISWDFSVITYIMKRVLVIDTTASLIVAFFYFLITYGLAYLLTLII
ncbi:MAG: hypothetical protein RL637_800 [Pseudomonadota bacterium]|jgi:hypothetical protein